MPRREDVKIVHPTATEFYQYRLGIRFDPGAEAEGFEPKFTLPLISFRGPGRVAGALRPLAGPQVWFAPQVGTQGIGGLTAGQIALAPLLDPSQQASD